MIVTYDSETSESLARGGTFDLTGTTIIESMQYWGFHASDGAVLAAIKGIPIKTAVTTLAGIRTAEAAIQTYFLTALTDPLLSNVLYRVDGYIITSVDLTSGTLHLYKTLRQISA